MTDKLKLVAPAEDWKSAVEISEETAADIRAMCNRLGLKYTDQESEEGRKLYVSRPASQKPPAKQLSPTSTGDGLWYPSGVHLDRHPKNSSAEYAPGNYDSASPLVMGPSETKLSEHFSLGEFRPNGPGGEIYTGVRVHPHLVETLEKIRRKVGATIHVTSGYRPPEYNRRAGGVPNSQHLDGLAADIYCDDLSTAALYDIADEVVSYGGGVGYYPVQRFVHVDVRGYRARW